MSHATVVRGGLLSRVATAYKNIVVDDLKFTVKKNNETSYEIRQVIIFYIACDYSFLCLTRVRENSERRERSPLPYISITTPCDYWKTIIKFLAAGEKNFFGQFRPARANRWSARPSTRFSQLVCLRRRLRPSVHPPRATFPDRDRPPVAFRRRPRRRRVCAGRPRIRQSAHVHISRSDVVRARFFLVPSGPYTHTHKRAQLLFYFFFLLLLLLSADAATTFISLTVFFHIIFSAHTFEMTVERRREF